MYGPTQPVQYTIAPASIRVIAWLIDMVILFLAVVVICMAADGVGSVLLGSPYLVPSFLPVILVVSAAYSIPLWKLRGATLGQELFRIYVYGAAGPVRLDWRHAAIRWLGPFGWMVFAVASLQSGLWVNVMLLAMLLVGVSVGGDHQRRFVHDHLSGSVVVQLVSVGAGGW